tara:strand:+ start:1494 stop:2897 length:1404 start_codon:yes stop_codon:yes gene_type:complete
MNVEQIYTGCLSQASYLVISGNEAAIIDPVRDIDLYLQKIKKHGDLKVKYIFETHFHADFVSGHLDLANTLGAEIIFGPEANTAYDIYKGKDGEIFALGDINFKLLHTPGHTLESSCFLLIDKSGKNHALFSGDTIFIGDVGRPDLAVSQELTSYELADLLYNSIHNKIYNLNDDLIIYPAHGAGSLCGKNMSSETYSTLGVQKQTNNALKLKSKKDFISYVIKDLPPSPSYFLHDVDKNKNGYKLLNRIVEDSFKLLDYDEFISNMKNDVVVLDTRDSDSFCKAFIKGAINISLNGSFAIWAARLIDLNKKILLVTDTGHEQESIVRLSRVGFENIIGCLKGGIKTWIDRAYNIDCIVNIQTDLAYSLIKEKFNSQKKLLIIDVRNDNEFQKHHIKDVLHCELSKISGLIKEIDKGEELLIHCAGGYRSMIAASVFKKNNFKKVFNVAKGIDDIVKKHKNSDFLES